MNNGEVIIRRVRKPLRKPKKVIENLCCGYERADCACKLCQINRMENRIISAINLQKKDKYDTESESDEDSI